MQGLRIQERALLLRRMAMLEEAEFIEELLRLRGSGEALPLAVEWRLRELFTARPEAFS